MGKPVKAAPGEISGIVDTRTFVSRLKLLNKFGERGWGRIPILDYVTIEFDGLGAKMKLSRYGIDTSLESTLGAQGTGAVALPAKTLLAFVNNADGDTISFEKKEDDEAVAIKCGRYNAALFPLDAGDAPRLQTPTVFERGFPLPEGILANLLALTAPFVSTEETRYYLNGVCFELEADKLRAVATDGHKLGTREAKLASGALEAWAMRPIVPHDTVSALAGIIGASQCTARFHGVLPKNSEPGKDIAWKPHLAQFSTDDWTITSKLIDGTFPDWRRVVPQPNPDGVSASINAADIRRFSTMLGGLKDSRAVKVSFKDGEAVALSGAAVAEGTMSGEARAKASGSFEPFGFNAKYFATIAKALGTDWLNIEIDGPSSPFLMRGKDAPEGELAVLMPMRI